MKIEHVAFNVADPVAVDLFQAWGIGGKGRDDGVLILLALAERRELATRVVASSGLTVNPYVFANMPLDPLTDLAPTFLELAAIAIPSPGDPLVPDGVSLVGRRPADEQGYEFAASSDTWARVVRESGFQPET